MTLEFNIDREIILGDEDDGFYITIKDVTGVTVDVDETIDKFLLDCMKRDAPVLVIQRGRFWDIHRSCFDYILRVREIISLI